MSSFHKPVMLRETVDGLNVKQGGIYIDATIGGGGHTEEIIARGGIVIGIDQDKSALLHVKKKFENHIKSGKLILLEGNFSEVRGLLEKTDYTKIDGLLLDLGVSSFQIDKSGRGFSFLRDEPLDMRMSDKLEVSAKDIIEKASEEELYEIFSKFGEERRARQVAEKIVEARQEQEIRTTGELVRIILPIIPRIGDTHPATRIFQALRISVNDELSSLRVVLDDGFKLLASGGRLSILTFHSLEDRIVKLYAQKKSQEGEARLINKKPIYASDLEIKENRRARSAKLRVIEKL